MKAIYVFIIHSHYTVYSTHSYLNSNRAYFGSISLIYFSSKKMGKKWRHGFEIDLIFSCKTDIKTLDILFSEILIFQEIARTNDE